MSVPDEPREGNRITTLQVVVLEDGKEVERKPLRPDGYIILCGERRYVAHVQEYLQAGTAVATIKRVQS